MLMLMLMRPQLVLTLLATIALGACGHRGPLTFPPQPTTLTKPAIAQPSATLEATSGKDSNTAGDAAR